MIREWANFFYCSNELQRNTSLYNILILFFLLTALDGLHYSPEEKKDLLNEYFCRLEEELLSSPEYYLQLMLWNAFIIIHKL